MTKKEEMLIDEFISYLSKDSSKKHLLSEFYVLLKQYKDDKLNLTDVCNPLKGDFCGDDGIFPNLDIMLYECRCGATKSF